MPIDQALLQEIENNNPTLTELDLSGQGITDEDIAELVDALQTNTNLKHLNLSAKKLGRPQVVAVKHIGPGIVGFGINRDGDSCQENCITAQGARLLAQTNITHLNLDYNPINDEGAYALANNSNLIELTICDCNISLKGIKAFLAHTALQELWYQSNPLINYGVEQDDEIEEELHEKIEERLKQNKLAAKPELAATFESNSNEALAINAASEGDLETLIAILPKLKNGVETRDNEFDTLLSCAAWWGHAHIVEYLLEHGANIEQDTRGYTPLFHAAERGHPDVVKVLLEHTGNILGEFEAETSDSIATFKLCRNITNLNEFLVNSNIEPPYFPDNQFNSLFDSLDESSPWELFEHHDDNIFFTEAALQYINALNNLIGENRELFNQPQINQLLKAIESYRKIMVSLKNRIITLVKEVDIKQLSTTNYDTDSEASDDSDDENVPITPRHRITGLIPAKKGITAEQAEEWIAKLNQDIKENGIETIDWSKYPKLFIANYRGVHFYRNHFTPEQRRLYRKDSHLNRITVCSATYELSDSIPAHAQFTRETQLKGNAEKLRTWHKSLENIKNPEASWQKGSDKRRFKTGRERHQQIYSNMYDRYGRELNTPGTFLHQEAQPLGHTKIPFLSTSLGPHHALLYAFGQKAPPNLKRWRLRPRFTKAGKTKRPYPGKVFIFLFSPADLLRHDVNHVVSMHAQGEVDIGTRIVSEGEVSAAGGIEQKNNFFEYAVKIPNFEGHRVFYQRKYGLSKEKFDELRKGIINSKPGTPAHKKAKNAIINELIKHQEAYLSKVVNKEVEKQGGILVYQDLDGGFSLTPPDIDEAKRRNKLAKNKKAGSKTKKNLSKKRLSSENSSSSPDLESELKKQKMTESSEKVIEKKVSSSIETTSIPKKYQLLTEQEKSNYLQQIRTAIEQKNIEQLTDIIQQLRDSGNLNILHTEYTEELNMLPTQFSKRSIKLGNVINLAVANVFTEGLALLLRALPTISIDVRNENNSRTPLEEILDNLSHGESAIKALKLLLSHRANPNTIIRETRVGEYLIGYIPLNYLITQVGGINRWITPEIFSRTAKLLLHYGANPNLEGREGLLPLAHIVKEIQWHGEERLEYYRNLVQILVHYGAKIELLEDDEQQFIQNIMSDLKSSIGVHSLAATDEIEVQNDEQSLTNLLQDSPLYNSSSAISSTDGYVDNEEELDRAALESQRSLNLIKINDENKECMVVPAKADGNCGFTATRQHLFLQGNNDLARNFYRENFIALIEKIINDTDGYRIYQDSILEIFKIDNATDINDWGKKFKSSGYWLQEAHFRFLSKYFNLEFNFYYSPSEGNQHTLIPEPSYESVYEGTERGSRIIISLAHVSTRLKNRPDATLNHYDTIIIEPTNEQRQAIEGRNYDFPTSFLNTSYNGNNLKTSKHGMFGTANFSNNSQASLQERQQSEIKEFYEKQVKQQQEKNKDQIHQQDSLDDDNEQCVIDNDENSDEDFHYSSSSP